MFKFSAKQKLAIKSWVHATIAVQGAFIGQWFYTNVIVNHNQKWDWATLGYAVAGGILAPLTRAFAKKYSDWAIKYPMLKPIALWITKRAAKKMPKVAQEIGTFKMKVMVPVEVSGTITGGPIDKALADSTKPSGVVPKI